MRWVADHIEKKGLPSPKGLLIINAFRDEPLDTRLAEGHARPFPHNVVAFAKSQRYALITGLQLFNMAAEIETSPTRASELAEALMTTDGFFDQFYTMPKLAGNP